MFDYLAIGHVTQDVTDDLQTQPRLGGTSAYAAVTAHSMGARPAVVTSAGPEGVDLEGVTMSVVPAAATTTFENRYSPTSGRRAQRIGPVAAPLDRAAVPAEWLDLPRQAVVHLAPVAGEVDPELWRLFPRSFLGLTPQGWMRRWDTEGAVEPTPWSPPPGLVDRADAVVLSIEDVGGDRQAALELVRPFPVGVVTEGADGAWLSTTAGGEARHLPVPTPPRQERDPTGAGDVFAAALFTCLARGKELDEAARVATHLAAESVTCIGLPVFL